MKKLLLILFAFAATAGCSDGSRKVESKTNSDTISISKKDILSSTILTAKQQGELTPDSVLARLKRGNNDFAEDNLTVRNNTRRVREAALGQYPKAVILSCLDSRVPVEDVFHSGIGNLFVARVAGNIVNEDILGSIEYGCKVSGAKLIVVLGHEYCGAIKSAINGVKLGNITALLNKIQPAVKLAGSKFDGSKTSANPAFVEAVCDCNVHLAINKIRTQSPILKQMEEEGAIKIVGAVYNMNTGRVEFLPDIKL